MFKLSKIACMDLLILVHGILNGLHWKRKAWNIMIMNRCFIGRNSCVSIYFEVNREEF